jgi:hypothetical protein
MRQRKWETHALHADGLRSGDLLLPFTVPRLLQNHLQSTRPLGFFQKQPDSFFEILEGLFLGTPA